MHTSERTGLPGTIGDGHVPAGEYRPLGSYAASTALFGAAFAGALVAARRSGRELPEALPVRDVVLTGLATQKLARVLTRYKVTG